MLEIITGSIYDDIIQNRGDFFNSPAVPSFLHYVGLRHPELFTAICARHGNFVPELAPAPLPGGILDIPVYLFTGSSDTACGTTGSPSSIDWYTNQGFNYLDTDIFTTYPSNIHTTDRHHALYWFLGL